MICLRHLLTSLLIVLSSSHVSQFLFFFILDNNIYPKPQLFFGVLSTSRILRLMTHEKGLRNVVSNNCCVRKGILKYERIFGKTYVSVGGETTTRDTKLVDQTMVTSDFSYFRIFLMGKLGLSM